MREKHMRLLAAGQGHRCNLGDATHVELHEIFDNK
jgi:hypothetical protein